MNGCDIVAKQNTIECGRNIIDEGRNIIDEGRNIIDEGRNIIDFKCRLCNKLLSCKKRYILHENNCLGFDAKTCPNCLKKFSSYQAKFSHIKNVKCSPPPVITQFKTIKNNTNNITNNNTTNNTNCNNQNIQINVFGGEDLSYLTNDKGILHRLRMYGKEGIYGLPKIIDDVHFNKERPENQTIIKPEEYGNTVLIKNDNNEWELREFEDVRDDMIGTIIKYFKAYNEVKKKQKIKLVEEKERRFIKTISYELMALDGCIPKDLFHELDMEDEIVEEDEIEIKNKTRKFDKCTMHTIHNRTTSGYKKENGSYIKKSDCEV